VGGGSLSILNSACSHRRFYCICGKYHTHHYDWQEPGRKNVSRRQT
jgi:hypothetical protein